MLSVSRVVPLHLLGSVVRVGRITDPGSGGPVLRVNSASDATDGPCRNVGSPRPYATFQEKFWGNKVAPSDYLQVLPV